ncbi:hypothetical protein FLA_4858 [Filimonas lacunae]|nr:hypothetical protein FLA_4858 [Filimonas lacunae]
MFAVHTIRAKVRTRLAEVLPGKTNSMEPKWRENSWCSIA